MYLIYFLNIDILALDIDILPDIINNDILFSYPNQGNKTNGGWKNCSGECVVLDGVGLQGRRPHDLFGSVRCTIEILMGGGAGVVDGDSSERCLSGVLGSLRSLF